MQNRKRITVMILGARCWRSAKLRPAFRLIPLAHLRKPSWPWGCTAKFKLKSFAK